jgi:hypothetical protein
MAISQPVEFHVGFLAYVPSQNAFKKKKTARERTQPQKLMDLLIIT